MENHAIYYEGEWNENSINDFVEKLMMPAQRSIVKIKKNNATAV
jgi:hypothetical protein